MYFFKTMCSRNILVRVLITVIVILSFCSTFTCRISDLGESRLSADGSNYDRQNSDSEFKMILWSNATGNAELSDYKDNANETNINRQKSHSENKTRIRSYRANILNMNRTINKFHVKKNISERLNLEAGNKKSVNYNIIENLKESQAIRRNCELKATNKSVETFSTEVLKHKYNFVHFNITFNGVAIEEDDQVILYNRWIWTYKGENGGHEYLFLPSDYGYLSLGLLWSYTHVKPMQIELEGDPKYCTNLTGGNSDTDEKIGDALGNMTKRIASRDDLYNSSYWCYLRRLHIDSNIIFVACENAICTIQTFEYSCCKYQIDFLTKERHVECNKHHYHFGAIWWLLPILIGELLFAYYPLLLASIGSRVRSFSRRRRRKSLRLEEMNSIDDSDQIEFIRVSKHKPPVEFLSTVCGPLGKCNTEGRVLSRLIRIMVIFLPLSLTTLRILLDYKYSLDLVRAAVDKGALVGFSTVLADFKSATRYFIHSIGGPFVALPLFVVFSCILIAVPSNLERVLGRGLIEFRGKSNFIITLSAENKARLAGVQLANTPGYKRIQKTLISQVLMLLNHSFWKQTFRLFVRRFKQVICPVLRNVTHNPCLAVILGIIFLVIYIVFCISELLLACIYFAFPVISCFFILIKAYIRSVQENFSQQSGFKRTFGHCLTIIITLMFMYTWYMYCLIFFDAFWFLTKIVMFTYTGVIAFPKISYGYLILCLMVLYYIGESFNSFQQSYQDLLSISIKACQKVEEKLEYEQKTATILCDDGILVDLWNLIVERHRPKRIQVTYTLFQMCAVILIVTVSLELLFRFDKFRELSLITHVFTALVICALPKIAKTVCTKGRRYRQQRKLLGMIKRTVLDYLNNEIDTGEPDIYDYYVASQYEELTD